MQDRPCIVQGSLAPVFLGTHPDNLECKSCNLILVKGYNSRALIALDIECFRCKSITRTRIWPVGEPLPIRLVTLGDKGRFLIKGSVDISNGASLSCDQEIQRVNGETQARQPASLEMDFSIEAIGALRIELSLLTEQAFDKALARAKVLGEKAI